MAILKPYGYGPNLILLFNLFKYSCLGVFKLLQQESER
jgi:hypothetical protein